MMKTLLVLMMTMMVSSIASAEHEDRPDLRPMPIPVIEPGSQSANPETRLGRLIQLMNLFNNRFEATAGSQVYLDSRARDKEYSNAQDRFISEMKKEGALYRVLLIGNDANYGILSRAEDHYLQEMVLVDEAGDFLAIVSEKAKYKDEFSRALPRVFPEFVLNREKPRVMIAGRDKVGLTGHLRRVSANQIQLNLKVANNMKEQTFDSIAFELQRGVDGKWRAVDILNQKTIKKLFLNIKIIGINPLSPNGGVVGITYDSRTFDLEGMPDPFAAKK